MHEDFSREDEIERSSDRSFGLVMAGFFALVGLAPLVRAPQGSLRLWALGLAAVFLFLALLWRAPLRPLNLLWHKLGLLLFRLLSPIFLALLFYASITPIGLLMRAFGKDPLRLKRDPGATSYWIAREPPGPPPASMKNQF